MTKNNHDMNGLWKLLCLACIVYILHVLCGGAILLFWQKSAGIFPLLGSSYLRVSTIGKRNDSERRWWPGTTENRPSCMQQAEASSGITKWLFTCFWAQIHYGSYWSQLASGLIGSLWSCFSPYSPPPPPHFSYWSIFRCLCTVSKSSRSSFLSGCLTFPSIVFLSTLLSLLTLLSSPLNTSILGMPRLPNFTRRLVGYH